MSVTIVDGGAIQVGISAGIGPSVIVNGTSTSIVGTAGVNPFVAGANITITTTGGGITVIGRDPPVYSVNGKSGTVVLGVVDITASPLVHTHTTTEVAQFSAAAASFSPVQSVAGRSGNVALTTHDIALFTAAVQSNSKVLSVQGKTGTVTLSVSDLTAAAASHTHATADISGFSAAVQTYSKVASVQGKTGTVTLSVTDISAAAAVHSHTTTDVSGFSAAVQSAVQAGIPTPYSVVTAVIQAGTNIILTPNSEAGTISVASNTSASGIAFHPYDGLAYPTINMPNAGGKYRVVSGMGSSVYDSVALPYNVPHGAERHILNTGNASSSLDITDPFTYNTVASLSGGQWGLFVAKMDDENSLSWHLVAKGTIS